MDVSLESTGSLKGYHRCQPPDTHIATRTLMYVHAARTDPQTHAISARYSFRNPKMSGNAATAFEWNIQDKHGGGGLWEAPFGLYMRPSGGGRGVSWVTFGALGCRGALRPMKSLSWL